MLAWVEESTASGADQASTDAEFAERFAAWLSPLVKSLSGVLDDDGNELSVGEWARAMVSELPEMAGFVARSIVTSAGVTEQQGNS